MRRHRENYGIDAVTAFAAGPPEGKWPCPIPQAGHTGFAPLMVGIHYLLRGGEVLKLNLGDVGEAAGPQGKQVTLLVTASKTDQEAKGEYVGRDCTCNMGRAGGLCPAHILTSHVKQRVLDLQQAGGAQRDAPLFVGATGERMQMKELLEHVEAAAKDSEESLRAASGKKKFGTRSLRVAGALLAFKGGAAEETVRALGRWATTTAMMAYLRGTPLVKAAGASRLMVAAMEAAYDPSAGITRANIRPVLGEVVRREESEEEDGEGEHPLSVKHGLTGLLHRPLVMTGPAARWTTFCGWRWAELGLAGAFMSSGARDARCARCFRKKVKEVTTPPAAASQERKSKATRQ